MHNYIAEYRRLNYSGPIQAVRIRVGDDSWFYNTALTITEDLAAHSYEKVFISEIRHYEDREENLDIMELVFSDIERGAPAYVNLYNSSLWNRDIPYFRKVREYIGHDYLFSPGASMIIENDRGEVAIARRSDDSRWAFPGGMKEPGESIIDTVHHETLEELGITVKNPRLLGIYSGKQCRVVYPNRDQVQFLIFLFKAEYESGELQVNDGENTHVAWIPRVEMFDRVSEKMISRSGVYTSFDGRVALDRFD